MGSRLLLGALAIAPPWAEAAAVARQALRALPPVCEGCLVEPLEVDYFGAEQGLGSPLLAVATTREEFEAAASRGHVLLIENASDGTAMEGWSCQRLSEEFPEARMRREYDWVTNPEDRNVQKVGSASWVEETVAGEESQQRRSQDPDAPPFAPFYWGVREHRGGDIGSKKVVKRIRKLIRQSVPKFMDPKNAESLFDNAEFWLGAKGTGARAHMDSHCISTLSVVLSGERRWRIGPVPRMPKGAGRSKDGDVVFDDGVAYKLGWKPMFEVVAKQGQAVLFPPGWIHETLNTAPGCTVALTTQFEMPRPARYYRSYYNRIRRMGDLHPCWDQMMGWATLGVPMKKLPATPAQARSHAEELFQARGAGLTEEQRDFYDIDEDGKVSKDEFVDTFVAWVATEKAVRSEKAKNTLRPDVSLAAPAEDVSAAAASQEL